MYEDVHTDERTKELQKLVDQYMNGDISAEEYHQAKENIGKG